VIAPEKKSDNSLYESKNLSNSPQTDTSTPPKVNKTEVEDEEDDEDNNEVEDDVPPVKSDKNQDTQPDRSNKNPSDQVFSKTKPNKIHDTEDSLEINDNNSSLD
jgi:hypothetical protein